MGPALLATILFSLSVVFASRTTRLLGGVRANLYRLCVATLLLAIWAHSLGAGFGGGAAGWFLFSGCIGFGFGDLALYQALPRVGPRLTGLLVQCLAAPFAAVAEWSWIGTELTAKELAAGTVILLGVGLAVAPREHLHVGRRVLVIGVVFGVLAALGQGLGAVISRKAYLVVSQAGNEVDGLSAAYQRIVGGLGVALPLSAVLLVRGADGAGPSAPRTDRRRVAVWVLLNALAGPAIGVGCYQWALATTPSGVVLPIVATMPVVIIPFAWWLEGDRPTARSVLGGLIAVGGTVALAGGR